MFVKKRDGRIEPFDIHKLIRVAKAAGLTPDQAENVGKNIEEWVLSLNKDAIEVGKLRQTMLTELKKISPYAANLYQWYENTKK